MKAKRLDPGIKKTLSLRESLVRQVDVSLNDPLTGEPAFGSWSGLIEELLEKWLRGEIKTSQSPKVVNLTDLESPNV